jgi:hypothetical protein
MNYFPLVSSIISVVFAFMLAMQYRKRRKRHQLMWSISLFMFFLATLLEFLAGLSYVTHPQSLGWSEVTYKLYYVLSPVMVALMGAGSLYLLAHVPAGKYFLYYTIAVTVPLFVLGFAAPIGQTLPQAVAEAGSTEIAGAAMPEYVRIFSPLLTIPGAIAIIGGALWSFWLDRKRKFSLLIALGGLFPSVGGLQARFGDPLFFYMLETAGMILLFVGFLMSWEYTKVQMKQDA